MTIRIIPASILAAALAAVSLSSVHAADQVARPVNVVAPDYSAELRHNGVEGDVLVRFTISKTGAVVNPEIVHSSNPYLEFAALAAVRQWTFTPALKDGAPVSVVAVQPISFVLSDRPSDAARMVTSKARKLDSSLN
jgi:TonB family protein